MTTERADDWTSTTSSLGGVRDKHRGIGFSRRARLTDRQLEDLYEQNSLIARVIDKIPDEAFREGWELSRVVTSDGSKIDPDAIAADLDTLNLNTQLVQAAKWSRLYGASAMAIPVADGKTSEEPMAMGSISDIYAPQVAPARDVVPQEMDGAFWSPTYRKVLWYQVQGLSNAPVRVHHSRLIVFEPIVLPPRAAMTANVANNGFGPSIIERMFDDLGRDGASASHAVAMMYVASILYVKLAGLRKDHSTADGAAKIRTMLATIRSNLDSLGVLGLDVGDEIGSISLTVAGAADLLDRMRDRLAASTELPREILFNESPAGLNAGELSGPQELFFATVHAWRQAVMTPAINRFLRPYFAARRIPAVSWVVRWRPLWTRSDADSAKIAADNATADRTYFDIGAVTGEEIRAHRFEAGRLGPIELARVEPDDDVPLDLSAPASPSDVAAHSAAVAAPPTAATSPADEALSGVQITSLTGVQKDYNARAITYTQARGAIALAFPRMRGREAEVLGPPPPQPDVLGGGLVAPAPAATPAAGALPAPVADAPASTSPLPPDLVTPQEAAAALHVPTRAITLWIQRGPTHPLGGLEYWGANAHKRVSLAQVAALSKAHENVADPAAAEEPGDAPAA